MPPWPMARSVMVTTVVVWGFCRAFMSAGAQILAGDLNVSPHPSFQLLVLLNLAVAWIVYLDFKISRERIILTNLGVSPLLVPGMASATALLCEVLLVLLSGIFAGGVGG